MSKIDKNKQLNQEQNVELKELFSLSKKECGCGEKCYSLNDELDDCYEICSIDDSFTELSDTDNDCVDLQPIILNDLSNQEADSIVHEMLSEIVSKSDTDFEDESFVANEFEAIEKMDEDDSKIELEDLVENESDNSFNFEFKDLDKLPNLNLEGFSEIELNVKFKRKNNNINIEKKCCKQMEKEEHMSIVLEKSDKECKCEQEKEKVFVEEIKSEDNIENDLNKLENIQLLDNLDNEFFDESAIVDNQYFNDFTIDENNSTQILGDVESLATSHESNTYDGEFFNNDFMYDDIKCDKHEKPQEESYDFEVNEPVFNQESYEDSLSSQEVMTDDFVLKSQEYRENFLKNKKEVLVDSNHQVIFDDSNFTSSSEPLIIGNKNDEQQVIFDETTFNMDNKHEFENIEPKKDLFDFDLVHEKVVSSDEIAVTLDDLNEMDYPENDVVVELKDKKEDKNKEEMINIEVPSFETFDIENLDNFENSNEEILELVNFNDDSQEETSEFQTSFPSINVDDEIKSLIDIEDIEVVSPIKGDFDSTELKIDDLEIEYVPNNDDEEFMLLEKDLSPSINVFENYTIDEQSSDVEVKPIEEIIEFESSNLPSSNLFTDSHISEEYSDIPVIETSDEVVPLDYSSYTVANYMQPEIIEKDNVDNFNNIEVVQQGELPSWYSQPSFNQIIEDEVLDVQDSSSPQVFEDVSKWHQQDLSQPDVLDVDREVIVRKETYPSIEEQLKKMKRPNLFRKYTMATAANMVILKSIDRLLNMTNSVIEKQATKRK